MWPLKKVFVASCGVNRASHISIKKVYKNWCNFFPPQLQGYCSVVIFWILIFCILWSHAVTYPWNRSADFEEVRSVCWPTNKPYADLPVLAGWWPTYLWFLGSLTYHYNYHIWNFICSLGFCYNVTYHYFNWFSMFP